MNLIPLCEAADRGELILIDGGMIHFHRRRDGIITIRELLVLPSSRRHGIGKWLVERIQRDAPAAALWARCPADWPANEFWRAIGFTLISRSKVNLWERQPRSSTALPATRSLPMLP